MNHSLQNRLVLGSAVASAVVLLGSAIILYVLIRAALITDMDASLAGEARVLASLVEEWQGCVEFELSERSAVNIEPQDRSGYYQLWRQDGSVIERSRRLQSSDLDYVSGSLDRPACQFTLLPDGQRGRMAGVTFSPRQATGEEEAIQTGDMAPAEAGADTSSVTLVVARDTVMLDHALGHIRILLAGVIGVALLLSLAANAATTRIGLRPLEMTARRIEGMDGRNLALRLDPSDAPDEIQNVIQCLNRLLERLDGAFARARAFSQNVAHELRTPLAGLRSIIEVALSRLRESATYQTTLTSCRNICVQSQDIVENLLSLVRIDAGRPIAGICASEA